MERREIMRTIWKGAILWYIGGMVYVLLEWLWRGWSHPSMFLAGGMCFVLIGALHGSRFGGELPLAAQALLGAVVVTAVELVTGLIVNVRLGWHVWDYSHLPLNFKGQISLYFFLLWIPLAGIAAVADDLLRHWLFHEPLPTYRWV
jgi:uncharacterized membrane protein